MRTARSPDRSRLDSAAITDPRAMPTGVAMTKPAFGVFNSTPGVASACSARNPADERNARDTSSTRASPRVTAAAPVV